jgi:hypothetical protein
MFASPIGGQSIGTPEPGSVAMLAALSLPGLILLRRRRGK